MAVPEPEKTTSSLTATYTSSTNEPFTHTISLPALSNPASTEDKTSYLSALRKAVIATQEKINTELTARMEEDKAKAEVENGKSKVDEVKEEENYGEEIVEED